MATTTPSPQQELEGPRPVQAGWWQQFWWRYSPHGELPISSAASWIVHLLVVLVAWLAAIALASHMREPPGLDVVALGDGVTLGPAGGGDAMPEGGPGEAASKAEFEPIASVEHTTEPNLDRIELPKITSAETEIPRLMPDRQGESDRQLQETDAELRDLRRILEANQNRGRGAGGTGEQGNGAGKGVGIGSGAGPGTGRGNIDANSTAGRQARWVITYPTLPQAEYEKMLDAFHIELAYVDSDRKTMQYLMGFSSAAKKRTGSVLDEDRMFWFWVGQNRLRELDDSILLKHGLVPASEVVHLYSKELELKLAEMEREYLKRQYRTTDVERVAQTNFKIVPGGPGGWHIEVTSLLIR